MAVIGFLVKISEHLDFFDELRLFLLATYQHISRILRINEFSFKGDRCFLNFRGKIQCGSMWLQKDYCEYLVRVNKFCALE